MKLLNGFLGTTSLEGLRQWNWRDDPELKNRKVLLVCAVGGGKQSAPIRRGSQAIARERGWEWTMYPFHEKKGIYNRDSNWTGNTNDGSLTASDVKALRDLLKRIIEALQEGYLVIPHCRASRHRAIGLETSGFHRDVRRGRRVLGRCSVGLGVVLRCGLEDDRHVVRRRGDQPFRRGAEGERVGGAATREARRKWGGRIGTRVTALQNAGLEH